MKKKLVLALSLALCLLVGLEGCQKKTGEADSETTETAEAAETETDKAESNKNESGKAESNKTDKAESDKTSDSDTSVLTGAEVISEDGTVSILLPDDTFVNTNSSGAAMEFETENGDYIYVEKGEDETAAGYIPESEDEFLASFEGIDAEIEIEDYVSDEDENGVKTLSYKMYITDYVAYENAEPQSFIILQNLTVDGSTYYNTYAEVTDEDLAEKVSASLATFGDTAE